MSKADRRARKRDRRNHDPARLRSRVVCDECRVEQPFRSDGGRIDADGTVHVTPCSTRGCRSETARFADDVRAGTLSLVAAGG